MTLVVALLTNDFVLLASDRRITTVETSADNPGQPVLVNQEDSDTKSMILDERFVMGFAGLGRVRSATIDPLTNEPRRQRIESWLAEALSGVPGEKYFEVIADKFGPVCEQQGYKDTHSFLAVGYSRADEPQLVRIDNRTASHTFYPYSKGLEQADFLLEYAGVLPDRNIDSRFRELITRQLALHKDRPDFYLRATRRVFAAVAARNGDVGSSCLITTMPRSSIPVECMSVWRGTPQSDTYRANEISTFYPASGSNESEVNFSPAFICPTFTTTGAESRKGSVGSIGPLEGM